jgi:hypothetical protein
MGSFDVACVISDLAIHPGDEVGFMLISESDVMKAYKSRQVAPEGGWIHYGLENDGYKPFLSPVFGNYDDYGFVVNIQESETTRFIESLFGKDVETVIKCVGSNRGIYSKYDDIFDSYFTGDQKFTEYDADFKESLLSLGFTFMKSDEGKDVYEFDGYHLIVEDSGDRYTLRNPANTHYPVILDKFHTRDISELLDIFGHYTHCYPGFETKDYWAIRTLFKMSGTYFIKEVYEKMSKGDVIDSLDKRRMEKIHEEWAEFTSFMKDPANAEDARFPSSLDYKFDTIQYLTRDTAYDSFLIDRIANHYENPEELWRMLEIRNILRSVNKVLLPNHCGEQHGNDEASDYLAKISRKILKKRFADRDWD